MRTVSTFCRICEALCGLEAHVEGDRVVQLRPNAQHIATRGFACIKGLEQHRIYDGPDRLRFVLRKDGERHVRASWDEALAAIGEKVARIRSAHHPDAIAMYVGTAAGFSILHPVFAQGFMQGVGSKNLYSSATQDCSNKFAVANLMYGFPFLQPFPDVLHTRCLVVVGANPAVSKWSFLQVSNPVHRLKQIVGDGGHVFIVDPRRTESAKAAGEHVFIRPGTDVFFYLSFLAELDRLGAIDETRVQRHMRELEKVRRLAAAWPAERTAAVTRIEPDVLRRIVRTYAEADGAALYSSTGVNMGGQGSLAFWLHEVCNAVSGNLDRVGGAIVGEGIFDFPGFAKKRGLLVRSDRSRVGGLPAVNDAFAGGVLADEILQPGPRQIRALFVTGGNPLLTMPGSARLREALRKLELLVVLDILPSETATEAHWVLPCTSPLQRPDLPFSFPLWFGMQSRPYLQATRAVVPPVDDQRDESSIYLDLCRAAGVPIFGSVAAQRSLDLLSRGFGLRGRKALSRVPQEHVMSLMLRLGKQGGFDTLADEGDGRPLGGHRPGSFLGQRVLTSDGKVDLAPPDLLKLAERLEADFQHELDSADRLKLITRRAIGSHNSWTHNHPKLAGKDGTNFVYVHPDDAARLGLHDGALADVSTASGAIRLPVSLCGDLQPGTVAVPHGWGHQKAKGLSHASKTRGVNVNLLAADGADNLDPVSGMARLTGIVVDVRPAAGPQDPSDWSGLPG
jgi:anaerobic selenocysteine-containing dehydrogenase